jgi:hypothetical protein
MHLLTRLAMITIFAIGMAGCQKIEHYDSAPDVHPVLPDPITASLQGNVFDENGQPAVGVTVRVGSKTAVTNAHGAFRILAASLDKHQALVTAEKSGYFKAYRSFAATSGANDVQIKLTRRSLAGTVSATAGGEASLSNGSKVALPSNGIVDATTGAAYTGTVSVYAAYIDPSAQDIGQTIPGSLMANDKDGRRVTLNSYGMMAVELEGASGQKLQIKTGSSATLTTAIPTAAQASAPATIALWYVDEASGLWKEQGIATKVGNTYVGTVSHFSFWNCDTPLGAIYLSLTIQTAGGQPLSHATVRITRTAGNAWNSATYGWTDSLGNVSGLVPANEALVLEVLDPCRNPVYTQLVGPFTAATSLSINASIPRPQTGTITGILLNCSGAPVTNGYAIVVSNNQVQYAAVNASGVFSTQFISCLGPSGTVDVIGIDNATQVQSSITTVNYSVGTTNLGNIIVCGISASEFINYAIDGGPANIVNSVNPSDSLQFSTSQIQGTTIWRSIISGFNANGTANIFLGFSGAATTGTYAAPNFSIHTTTQPPTSNVLVNITAWPATVGSFIEGTIGGSYTDNTGSHSISGNFKLRRNF